MSTDTTPPPVGTIMRWHDLQAEVLLSSPEYMVARDTGAWLRAMRQVGGKWRDHDGDVWEIVTAEPAGDGTATTSIASGLDDAIGALGRRLIELEAVVEEMNRRLCGCEDEIDELLLAQASDLPTLPVGTVLKCVPCLDNLVVRSERGFVLAINADGDRFAMAWVNGGWRTASYGGHDASSDVLAWEVQL